MKHGWILFQTIAQESTGRRVMDLICVPVADDDVYQTFILYTSGVYTREQTINALKIKKLYDQYVFTTDQALSFLKFKEVVFGKESF